MIPVAMVVGSLGVLSLAACGDDSGAGGGDTASSNATTGSPTASSVTGSSSTGAGGGGDGTLVVTDKGPVKGAVLGNSRVFLGIPFAAPPIDALRWKLPQPHEAWTDAIDATMRKPACAQLGAVTPTFDDTTSEDCLTLNVWAPKNAPTTPLPVMVWIYGGSFVIGSGADAAYDGQKLAEATSSVVVTINYRLGPLGFFAHSDLETEDAAHPSTGMYGFEDQRAAMAWTRANIAAFGGDAAKVTVFGESAGGISACLHLVAPASDGLFDRAIIESGGCAGVSATTSADAKTHGDALVTALGCDGADPITCMRGKTTEEIVTALPVTPFDLANGWSPNVDGFDLPSDPAVLLASGDIADVPVLLGSNDDEGSLFFAFGNPVTDDATYLAYVEQFYPGQGAAILAEYPSATYGSAKAAAIEAFGDGGFVCPARRTARALANAGRATWLYHFNHAPAALLPDLGAYHSSELPFVFGNAGPISPMSPTAEEAPLVATMQGYWGRMAATGDPNGGGAASWPAYDEINDQNVVLDLTVSEESGRKNVECDFWDSL